MMDLVKQCSTVTIRYASQRNLIEVVRGLVECAYHALDHDHAGNMPAIYTLQTALAHMSCFPTAEDHDEEVNN